MKRSGCSAWLNKWSEVCCLRLVLNVSFTIFSDEDEEGNACKHQHSNPAPCTPSNTGIAGFNGSANTCTTSPSSRIISFVCRRNWAFVSWKCRLRHNTLKVQTAALTTCAAPITQVARSGSAPSVSVCLCCDRNVQSQLTASEEMFTEQPQVYSQYTLFGICKKRREMRKQKSKIKGCVGCLVRWCVSGLPRPRPPAQSG